MRTKEEKIDLLMRFVKGEIPLKQLKEYKLTWFFCLQEHQRQLIADRIGSVRPSNCSPYNPNEQMIALWNGIPIGLYLSSHMSMVEHPDSPLLK